MRDKVEDQQELVRDMFNLAKILEGATTALDKKHDTILALYRLQERRLSASEDRIDILMTERYESKDK